MKILFVDHNAAIKSYRFKYRELQIAGEVEFKLLIPRYIDYSNSRGQADALDSNETFDAEFIAPYGSFKAHRGFLNPFKLASVIRNYKPEIIFIDSEPESWYTFETIFIAKLLRSKAKIAVTTWMNINLYKIGFPYFFGNLYKFIYKYTIKRADKILCYTSEADKELKENGFKGEICKISWGVDTNTFVKIDSAKLKSELGLDGFVAGYCGRMVEEKGIIDLISAVKEITQKNVCLLLIGSGNYEEEIQMKALEMGVNFKIIKNVENHRLPQYLNCMDVLVLPSRTKKYWKEQFGRVLIEAMSCGVNVIGSDSGEIPYVVGNAGLIFKEGDVKDLAENLKLLIYDQKLRIALREKGIEYARNLFDWGKVAKRLIICLKDF